MKSDLITRLNPKISDMTASKGGWGALTNEDIAQALSGLKDAETALAFALHGNEQGRQSLLPYLMYAIEDSVKSGEAYLKIICQIAIHEELGEVLCLECGGRGVIYREIQHPDDALRTNEDGLLPVDCTAAGCVQGTYRMTNDERGHLIAEAIDEKYTYGKWRGGWCWDYASALSQLAAWRNKVESHLSRRLE